MWHTVILLISVLLAPVQFACGSADSDFSSHSDSGPETDTSTTHTTIDPPCEVHTYRCVGDNPPIQQFCLEPGLWAPVTSDAGPEPCWHETETP